MSSSSDLNNIFQGTMSKAGKASAEKFNIEGQMTLLKGKKALNDIFTKEPNINSYISKEKDIQKEIVTTPKQGVRLKLNIKKYYKDYIRKALNNNLILNISPKKGNKSTQKKEHSLKDKKTKKKETKLLQNDYNKLKKGKKNENKNENNLSPFYNKIKYKFHNIHLKRVKEINAKNREKENREPMYKPNLEYIYRKSLSGPEWSNIMGRKKNIFDEPGRFLDKFYNVESSSINDLRRTFVNMAKQTKKTTAYFSQDLSPKKKSKKIFDEKLKLLETKKINEISTFPITPILKNRLNLLKKNLSLKQIKNNSDIKDKIFTSPLVNKCKSIPDFTKTKGRSSEHRQDKKIKNSNAGIYYPNYDFIKERTKMMVLYQNNKNDKNKNYNDYKFKGLNSVDIFSATDSFNKLKSNKSKIAPVFEKMSSRPQRDNLPTFMQGLFNRLGAELMTDKSLKLNNYSNLGYYDLYKNNLTNPKQLKKKEENESSFSFDISNSDFEENKNNEIEEQAKTNKIKIEINKIVSKMDKLYNNYLHSKI